MLAEAFDPPHWMQYAVYIGAALIVLAGVWTKVVGPWVIKPAAKAMHEQMIDVVEAQTTLIRHRQDSIDAVIADIKSEVTYNGGNSLKDVVRQTATKVDQILLKLENPDV